MDYIFHILKKFLKKIVIANENINDGFPIVKNLILYNSFLLLNLINKIINNTNKDYLFYIAIAISILGSFFLFIITLIKNQ